MTELGKIAFVGVAARRRFDDAMSNLACWWADMWD